MFYTYPDRNDELTVALIAEVSKGDYWGQSEKRALDWALEAVERLPRPRRMLDLGCGTGRLEPVFAPHVDEILAVEPDRERYASAAETTANLPSVTVCHGDASAVDPEEKFEVLLCSHVLQHVDDGTLEALLTALETHSAPGALAVVTTTFTTGTRDILTAEWWESGTRRWETLDGHDFRTAFTREGVLPVRLFARSTVESLFESFGFRAEGFRLYHYPGGSDPAEDDRRRERGDETARDVVYLFRRV